MNIINREQFLQTPDNTIYCKVDEYQNFGDTRIKLRCGDGPDFYQVYLNDVDWRGPGETSKELEQAYEDSSISLPMDFEASGRDGYFDDSQMFAVFDHEDVKKLILRFVSCLDMDAVECEKDGIRYILNAVNNNGDQITITTPKKKECA